MKNIDNIILKTSKDLDLSKEKVKIVIDKYWETVSYRLTHLESTTIFIRNVGLITVSKFKLKNYIKKLIANIRFMKRSEEHDEDIKQKTIVNYTNKLSKALKQRNIIAKHYAKRFNNI